MNEKKSVVDITFENMNPVDREESVDFRSFFKPILFGTNIDVIMLF